jgi:hypothetical protein
VRVTRVYVFPFVDCLSKFPHTAGSMADVHFRPPSTIAGAASSTFVPPPLSFVEGMWHVAYSTLPMWKSNRNVTITYTPHPDIEGAWDNLVKYQPVSSEKWKTVEGVEKPDPNVASAWNWRGNGWLKIASSHWQVLGYGGNGQEAWCVIWFEKTLFTPAGMDVLVKRSPKDGSTDSVLKDIHAHIDRVNEPTLKQQSDKLFPVKHE